MTNSAKLPIRFRRLLATVVVGLAICHLPFAPGAAAGPSAVVVAIESTRVADLVLLDRGFDAGLRAGMVCRISRGTTEIAEVQLVELRSSCSSALILALAPKQSIRAGDVASVKLQKS